MRGMAIDKEWWQKLLIEALVVGVLVTIAASVAVAVLVQCVVD